MQLALASVERRKDRLQRSREVCEARAQESSLEVTGLLRRDDRAPRGFEMEVRALKGVSIAREYPSTPK